MHMETLQEFGVAALQIREALEELTVKGSTNASIILLCTNKCSELINAVNEVIKSAHADAQSNTKKDPPTNMQIDARHNET